MGVAAVADEPGDGDGLGGAGGLREKGDALGCLPPGQAPDVSAVDVNGAGGGTVQPGESAHVTCVWGTRAPGWVAGETSSTSPNTAVVGTECTVDGAETALPEPFSRGFAALRRQSVDSAGSASARCVDGFGEASTALVD